MGHDFRFEITSSKDKLFLSQEPFIWCLYVWRCLYKEYDESAGISYP